MYYTLTESLQPGSEFIVLNFYTPKDPYPLPLPDRLYDEIAKECKYLSMIDVKSGFLNIPIEPSVQHLTAFWWKKRLWQYTRCPFGLINCPSHFQRVMDMVVTDAGLQANVKVYIDDCCLHTNSYDHHLEVIERFMAALQKWGLKAHPTKSKFLCETITFLGHDISAWGMAPSESKVKAIRALPVPTDVHTLRRLLGFMCFYRGYVPGYSAKAGVLNELLKKDVKWEWTPERDQAWHQLKDELC